MSRRLLVAAAVVLFGLLPCLTGTANAQDLTMERISAPVLFAAANTAMLANAPADAPQIPFSIRYGRPESGSSLTLNSLYASTVVLQMLDVHSTFAAMKGGAVEGNPLMSGLTSHKPAFVAVKAAIAGCTIMAVKNIAKKNKLAAIATLLAINSTYAFVVSHNYGLAHSLR